jgi:pimeloyl-ACP methyl ester carboxylesterase
VLGATYEAALERTLKAHQPPGELVSIGSHRLHLHCTGAGDPPVVLIAGSGLASTNWGAVQAGLTDITRVCSYDRTGLGWSDRGPSTPSADQAVAKLYALLGAAGIEGPWVLVGHSLGGLYAQQFMNLHSGEVAALVLLDSAHEEQFELVPYFSDLVSAGPLTRLSPLLTMVGLHRLSLPRVPEDDPTWVARQLHATSKHVRRAAAEWWSMKNSAAQLRAARRAWGDVPLIAFLAAEQNFPSEWTEAAVAEAEQRIYEMNQELADRSSSGRNVVVEGSGHGIPWERPDVVIAAVDSLVQEYRRAVRVH